MADQEALLDDGADRAAGVVERGGVAEAPHELRGQLVARAADTAEEACAHDKLGAWGSDQSAAIESRDALVRQIRGRAGDIGIALGESTTTLRHENRVRIERPSHWGGYRLWVTAIELWMEGADRIHDRALWTRDSVRRSEESFSVTPWTGTRLQP
jgi:pyridoxine/pyridoxamine 5'-phosphate oxidase